MKRGDKPTSDMTGSPFVDPTVAARTPQAAAYARSMEARKGGDPRGGGPTPPIPRLDMPHQDGMTMADQAAAMRQPQQGPPAGGIFGGAPAPSASPPQPTGIMTSDLLPEQARNDPRWQDGHGSSYAVNQPHLALKYGVIRNGQFVPPQQLQTGRAGLSPKTVEGLKAVQDFQKTQDKVANGDYAAESAAREGLGGVAAQTPEARHAVAGELSDEAKKSAVQEAVQNMDDFDYNALREHLTKDLFNNDEEREIVESRLKPLDLSELIINGRCRQKIPVRPGVYEPELQSLTGEEELALKRLLIEEKQNIGADRYLLDKYQLMVVACALFSINNTALPSAFDSHGRFNDELFWTKFNMVLRMPFHLIASVGVHYFWFDIRVRRLFTAERLKNG